MTVQDFCLAYRFPLTRTSQAARKLAEEALAQTGKRHKPKEIDLPEYGFRVTRVGESRLSYRIYSPESFRQTMIHRLGIASLLSNKQVALLLAAAQMQIDYLSTRQLNREGEAFKRDLSEIIRRFGDQRP